MENLILISCVSLLALVMMQGYEKGHLTDMGNALPKIIASKTLVYPYQLGTLLFTGAANTDSVNWGISPAGNSTITTKANAASVVFSEEGTYVVTAQKENGTPASITIKVTTNTSNN